MVAPHLGGLKIDAAWLEDRFNWRDANGVPQKPEWTNDENMEDLRLKQQLDLRRQKLEEDDILICVDEEEIFEEHAEILQDHPAFRHMKFTKMLEKMEADEKKYEGGKKKTAAKMNEGQVLQNAEGETGARKARKRIKGK